MHFVRASLLLPFALLGCATAPPSSALSSRADAEFDGKRAYVGGTVIPAPNARAIPDGVVVLDGKKIVYVGAREGTKLAAGVRTVDCHGATVLAAFWNAHVHFTESVWADAARKPKPVLDAALRDMLSRWGFAHVFDTGSFIADTNALRGRITSGDLTGPDVRTTGGVFVAEGGQPAYITTIKLPELKSPAAARAMVTDALENSVDAIKLMTASVVLNPPPPVMPVPIVRAVTETAHAKGALVFAHPTNRAGLLAARDGGVDILAHTAPAGGPWSEADARSLVAAGMSLIPTLSLWRREVGGVDVAAADHLEQVAKEQVRVFAAASGTLLFGTDVGYRPEYDTTPEHELLAAAGLSFEARLAMLTTAPAARFHAERTGRLAEGLDGDLVVLEGDPRTDPRAFSHVRCTVRRGATLYESSPQRCEPKP